MECAEAAVAHSGQNGKADAAAETGLLLRAGLMHLQRAQYEAADAAYTATVQLDPQNVVAYTNRGAARAGLGDSAAAQADLDRALEISPGFALALETRGDLFVSQGKSDQAIADYSRVLRSTPFTAPVYLKRGDAYQAKQDYDRAIADYSRALRLDPLDPRALLSRGMAYRLRGLHKLALADLQEAVKLDPQNHLAYAERAFAFRALGQFDAALSDFDAALRLDSNNAEIFYERGRTRELQGDVPGAVKDLDEAIQRKPESAMFLNARGLLRLDQDQVDLAIFDFTAALRIDANMAQAYYNRASAWTKKGRFDKTVSDSGRAIALEPKRVDAYFQRANAYAQQGLHELARSDIDRALAADPENGQAYHVRAVIWMREGEYEKALADFSESIRLNPKNALTHARRSMAYQLLEQHERALADLHQAVLLDPQYTTAYCNQRAVVHASTGAYEQALADYAIALQLDRTNVTALAGREQLLRALEERANQPAVPEPKVSGVSNAPKNGIQAVAQAHRAAETQEIPVGKQTQELPAMPADSPSDTSPLELTLTEENAEVVVIQEDGVEINAEDWEIVPDRAVEATPRVDSPALLAPETSDGNATSSRSRPQSPEEIENRGPRQARLLREQRLEEIEERKRRWAEMQASEGPAGLGPQSKALASPDSEKAGRTPKAVGRKSAQESEYEQEQALLREREQAEEQRRTDLLRSEDLQKKRIQAKAAALLAKHQKQRAAPEDDDRTFLERWRNPLMGVAAILVLAVLGYFGWGFYMTHRKFDPPLDAADVWQEYHTNPEAADRKYARQRFFVSGKIVIEQRGGKKGPRDFYFQPPGKEVLRIHCTFSASNELGEVPNGLSKTAYLISGEFQPYDKGPLIEMTNCEFIGGTTIESALPSALQEGYCGASSLLKKVSGTLNLRKPREIMLPARFQTPFSTGCQRSQCEKGTAPRSAPYGFFGSPYIAHENCI